ncbi:MULTISPECIES: cytochrome P450 [Nocardiopsis]|uniref:Cytochrome P450 n=2 Tax=Nocardiopsis alba TaxID=53437 RepID=A0A7K2ILM7_9ACTN|nr:MULTISPECIES: cytochrome P450 [Nocardiopsis]AFR10088.1 cytochrome P450 family protein [Nocardiopsis alba ATCC BAA-2165]MEC3895719.1 cytochrome P450 [Nocardiopsis sp. LDBS1602]MYR30878.1 cytochrome P450 [Nocardiopsis alba]
MPTDEPVKLYTPEFREDTAVSFRRLRERHGPVVPVLMEGDLPAWLVIGYRELHHVLTTPSVFARNPSRWNAWDRVPPDWSMMPVVMPLPNMLSAEGEEHAARARAVNAALGGVDPHELGVVTERLADRLIDAFRGSAETELITTYADRLPALVLCWMFGLDGERGDRLTSVMTTVFDAGPRVMEYYMEMATTVGGLVAERRARPGPDVVSRLAADPRGYTDEEIVPELLAILGGGHQTTSAWIGNALRLMLTDDRFSASFSGARSSVGEALNEVLWEDSPSQMQAGRYAAHDVDLGGRRIREGDMVLLGYAAANQDPVVRSARGRDERANHAHLSFSHGEHGCPYAARTISETIAATAVEVLLDRLPDVELAVAPSELRWRPSPWLRGVQSLPVTFTPASPEGAL